MGNANNTLFALSALSLLLGSLDSFLVFLVVLSFWFWINDSIASTLADTISTHTEYVQTGIKAIKVLHVFANENHGWTTAEDASSWTFLKKRTIFFSPSKMLTNSVRDLAIYFPLPRQNVSLPSRILHLLSPADRVDVNRGPGLENNPWVAYKRKCGQQEGSNSFEGWNPRSPAPSLLHALRCISIDHC